MYSFKYKKKLHAPVIIELVLSSLGQFNKTWQKPISNGWYKTLGNVFKKSSKKGTVDISNKIDMKNVNSLFVL